MKDQYNREKSIAITGSSGLAAHFSKMYLDCLRIDDVLRMKDYPWEVFINHAHRDFDQTLILDKISEAWKDQPNKLIINISSRAAFPNLSQGRVYSAQKASLDHLANNITYNSKIKCRITTLNLGYIQDDSDQIPGCTWQEVHDMIWTIIDLPKHLEIPNITMQHSHPYKLVQEMKENIKCNQ